MDRSTAAKIEQIRSRLPDVMLQDKSGLMERLERIAHQRPGKGGGKRIFRELKLLKSRVDRSIREREKRLSKRPRITFSSTLPITAKQKEIIQAIRCNQVVVISGETGSGKSTQIPKMCLAAGQGIAGKIGCTQPRRIAATTISRRIAEEMGEELGQSVGYKIRFNDKSNPHVYIKVVTDGMLLAETQRDPRLYEYDTLIIDEAHERNLNIDFLLGILRRLLLERPDLKLIITSATLDTEKFSAAFDHAPVIEIGGQMYPVEVKYMPVDSELEDRGDVTYVDMAVRAINRLQKGSRAGDFLVFMPTEKDIIETCERLEGRQYLSTTVIPLYARLPGDKQGRVYTTKGRKIVVATNVAETSLTIPGIKYVIDTGLARISRYLPSTRTSSLPISPISKSSAEQRKGRCGRVQKGICIRLYSEEDYESRQTFTSPEIQRANLAEVILRMISLNLGDPASFPFLDKPSPRSIKDGIDLLLELGAIERQGNKMALTERGKMMARMPLDPRISRMLLEAQGEDCMRETAIIASALSIQDPRERPAERAKEADQVHLPFRDPQSDFLTLLNIWNQYHHTWERLKTQSKMRKFCRQHFLSFPRMREWIYTRDQIITILKEQRIRLGNRGKREISEEFYAGIHKSVLSGYLSNIAVKKDKNIYLAARGREAMVFPGSTLFNTGSPWIVAAEMVKTSRLFARAAARIDPQWLETLGGSLCKSSYSHPHWEKNRGEVRANEQVSLYGLVIIPKRSVSFGPINPDEAHEIFVRSALVEGQVKEQLPFLRHNLKLVRKIEELEDKIRRRGLLITEDQMAEFYSINLKGIYNIRSLKKAIKDKGGDGFLRMREEDLLISLPDQDELGLYPDQITFGETRLKTSYKFTPGKEEDGVTVSIPSAMATSIPVERLDWEVPGMIREKALALIKGLPKKYRKQLVPVSETVEVILAELEKDNQPFVSALARFIYKRFGVDVPATVWSSIEIPNHLRMRFSVVDHRGRELESGRDGQVLDRISPPDRGHDSRAWKKAQEEWEKKDIKSWSFGSLPESIILGPHQIAYPGLESGDDRVQIRLFDDQRLALNAHKEGIQTLFCLHFAKDLKFLKRNLSLPQNVDQGAAYFGGVKAFEKTLYESLMRRLFHRNIRSQEEFESSATSLGPTMMSKGGELRDRAVKLIQVYQATRATLHDIENGNRSNRAVLGICEGVRADLSALVPEDFLKKYSDDRLSQIPRYLKAMKIRIERGANAPDKDRQKMAKVEVYTRGLHQIKEALSIHASDEKREAVKSLRWMIEEFKVSLFAQELKTPFPISKKRLDENMKEIERMV